MLQEQHSWNILPICYSSWGLNESYSNLVARKIKCCSMLWAVLLLPLYSNGSRYISNQIWGSQMAIKDFIYLNKVWTQTYPTLHFRFRRGVPRRYKKIPSESYVYIRSEKRRQNIAGRWYFRPDSVKRFFQSDEDLRAWTMGRRKINYKG